MPDPYEELIDGETFIRGPLNGPHEVLCDRLHAWVARHLPANSALKLLPRRTTLTLRAGTVICPDLALVRRDNNELYLAAEVLQPGDHHPDTVLKKQVYSDCRVPRLWVVDSRYQNVEVYGSQSTGFRLEWILASHEFLTDAALNGSSYPVADIFSRH
ncbi:Uma2 family endonuclease [Rariglobus hedericola]|uniref:Uma2 family endonuclease n=1 Tax=Rariglobus hedericola TaxID=2597822 RepID=A0A556QN85_9BACT|nr:Uma2 family endonuclease [Rariglobus hedericola]TSJ78087.1 Uma2 family endonuclease [Rariglobus hedericola]